MRRKTAKRQRKPYTPADRYYAPYTVTIDTPEPRAELLHLLSQLREHFKNKRETPLVIDFSRTHQFVCCGTLLLLAELNRLIDYAGGTVKLRCTEPANERASQVLKQVGIYNLCSNKCAVNPDMDDVVHWKVAHGEVVDNSLCAPTIEGYQGQLGAEMTDELLGGLGEAMTNVIHHAYDTPRQDGLDFKCNTEWWMFSQVRHGELTVAICDLGVGIPATLPLKRPTMWQRLIHRTPTPTDEDCIREAIVEGVTSTRLDERGYGLGNIVSVVEGTPGGVVMVYSNSGRYDALEHSPYPRNYSDSIMGTMILWKVPMNTQAMRTST